MKYLSLFSGIGAFEKALDKLNKQYELVAYCDIDKYASKSYSAIHNVPESMNLWDITKVDEKALPKDIDLITYGFPCQDISLAGKQKGLFNEDGTQTRSGLFFEALRIIEETQPRVAIAENVKNLTSKKFNAQFQIVLESLEQAGYNNYWQVLNAKDYGIPQNRERVFIVSIRKDIDTGLFQFPEGFPLELRLKDVLEDEVDEKYYLKPKDTNAFKMFDSISEDTNGCIQVGNLDRPTTHDFSNRVYSPDGLARTLMGSGGNQNDKAGQYLMRIDIPQTVKVRKYPVDTDALCEVLRHHKALADQNNNGISNALGVPVTKVEHWFRRDDCFAIPDPDIWFKLKELLGITTDEFDEAIMTFEEKEGVYEKSERHYFAEGISPTLTSTSAGNEKILVREATKTGYAEAYEGDLINMEHPNSKTRRGRVGHGVAQTLTTSPQQAVVESAWNKNKNVPLESYIEMAVNENIEIPCAVDQQNVLVRKDGCVGTLTTDGSSAKKNNRVIVECTEPFIVASRGRNPENPSDRTAGAPTVQRLEPNSQGICNTLTTVLKDNYVVEPSIANGTYKLPGKNFNQSGIVHGENTVCRTLIGQGHAGNEPKVLESQSLRIRKLTPKECFRLMGFDDEDFLAAKVGDREAAIELLEKYPNHQGKKIMSEAERISKMSNTQLYKQAGNSIVVDVPFYIFQSLIQANIL